MRVGNDAATQLQLDIYGELVDSIYLYDKHGTPISHRSWDDLTHMVNWVCENWEQADEGIWETRGRRQQFTYSRLQCWVAVERTLRMATARGLPADRPRLEAARDRIYRQIHERGWNQQRQAFVQHYDTDVLDASVLLMPLMKFIAPRTRVGSQRSTRSAASWCQIHSSTATTPRPPRRVGGTRRNIFDLHVLVRRGTGTRRPSG